MPTDTQKANSSPKGLPVIGVLGGWLYTPYHTTCYNARWIRVNGKVILVA